MGFKTAVMDEEGCGVRAGVTSASCRQTRAHHAACLCARVLRVGHAAEWSGCPLCCAPAASIKPKPPMHSSGTCH